MDHLPPSTSTHEPSLNINTPWRRPNFWGLILGSLFLVAWLTIPGLAVTSADRLLGIWVLTILWWITEPIPIPATGLLAISLCFLLGIPQELQPTGKTPDHLKTLLVGFSEPTFFFLMGGMYLGLAMMRHGLDRRFALAVLCAPGMGTSPARVLLAIGACVTIMSMFISNTAATAIVFPIALQILDLLEQGQGAESVAKHAVSRSKYGTALLLMSAYASSVGGISTPIGTTTNVIAMGLFRQESYFGRNVNFLNWMLLGVPVMIALFGLLYLLLWWYGRGSKLDMRSVQQKLLELQAKLGPWKRGEVNTCLVFAAAMICWTLPGFVGLFNYEAGDRLVKFMPEELIALLIPVALYLLPIRIGSGQGTLVGDDLSRIDWGALILFGTGLTLGNLVRQTKLADNWAMNLYTMWPDASEFQLIGLAALAGLLLSELTSNAAAANTLIPVVWGFCKTWGVDPLGPMMALTFAASFGSALPVSTPPNTLVYSSGRIPMRRMITVGLLFDVLCWLVVWFTVALFTLKTAWSPWL
jgi:solute carrier family 13 (sodium-dependent dicarboxylate transporter), member 2/3/5